MVTLDDARAVKDTLINSFNPYSIVVFGSVAKKETGNDLDIIIVLTKKTIFKIMTNYCLYIIT